MITLSIILAKWTTAEQDLTFGWSAELWMRTLIFLERILLARNPKTKRRASMTLLLPLPFGPRMEVKFWNTMKLSISSGHSMESRFHSRHYGTHSLGNEPCGTVQEPACHNTIWSSLPQSSWSLDEVRSDQCSSLPPADLESPYSIGFLRQRRRCLSIDFLDLLPVHELETRYLCAELVFSSSWSRPPLFHSFVVEASSKRSSEMGCHKNYLIFCAMETP